MINSGHIGDTNLYFVMFMRYDWREFPFIPEGYQILEESIKFKKVFVKALEKQGLCVEINHKMFEENVIE